MKLRNLMSEGCNIYSAGFLLAFLLTGCGGSDGGENNQNNTAGKSDISQPESENQNTAPSATATDSSNNPDPGVTSSKMLISSDNATAAVTLVFESIFLETSELLSIYLSALSDDLAFNSGKQINNKAVVVTSTPCEREGTMNKTWNDADNDNKDSAGDTLSVVFENCLSKENMRAIGSYTAETVKPVENPWVYGSDWSAITTINFLNYSLTNEYSEKFASANGSETNDVGCTGINCWLSRFASDLTVRKYNGQQIQFKNFSSEIKIDDIANLTSVSAAGQIASANFDLLTIETQKPILLLTIDLEDGIDILQDGRLKISDAQNNSITVTVLGEEAFQLSVDNNGDGNSDILIDITLDELQKLMDKDYPSTSF